MPSYLCVPRPGPYRLPGTRLGARLTPRTCSAWLPDSWDCPGPTTPPVSAAGKPPGQGKPSICPYPDPGLVSHGLCAFFLLLISVFIFSLKNKQRQEHIILRITVFLDPESSSCELSNPRVIWGTPDTLPYGVRTWAITLTPCCAG